MNLDQIESRKLVPERMLTLNSKCVPRMNCEDRNLRESMFLPDPNQDMGKSQKSEQDASMNSEQPEQVDAQASEPRQLSWEDMLSKNGFHDIANDDEEMYDEIEDIPIDSGDLADKLMAVVKNHVSEVWSQPRETKLAHEFGLDAGFAYDLLTCDETGEPWDCDLPHQREKCLRNVMERKPQFLIGSPMCTALSALQSLNKWRMNPKKWEALMEKGIRHMRFAAKFCRLQAEQGRWLLHEHPNSASSWKLPEVQELMNDLGIQKTAGHMCRYGMQSMDEHGSSKVKQTTGFLANSAMLVGRLSLKLMGGHRHIQLVGDRLLKPQLVDCFVTHFAKSAPGRDGSPSSCICTQPHIELHTKVHQQALCSQGWRCCFVQHVELSLASTQCHNSLSAAP